MKSAKADEAAFPYPENSGGMTMRQFVALKFATAALNTDTGIIFGESEEHASARRLSEDQIQMRRAFELADAFLTAQEVKP